MAKQPKTKIVNRRHVARLEVERRQRKTIIIAAIAIGVIVLGLLGFGLLDSLVIQPNKVVARVGEKTITVREYQKRVKYNRFQALQNISQYDAYNQLFGAGTFDAQIQQALFELIDTQSYGRSTLDQMITEEVLLQVAAERGITVTSEEVEKAVQEAFGYFASGTPTVSPTETVELKPTSTLSSLQMTLVPPTATPMLTPTPEETEEPTATPTQAPTATPTEEAAESAEVPPSPTPEPLPTETPYTLEGYQQVKSDYLNAIEFLGFSEADLRELMRRNLIIQKLYDEIIAEIPLEQEQVWARHILVTTEEEANQVIQLLNDGEDFAKLAQELSLDKVSGASGGDLGWFARGQMVEPFEEAAFSLEIGELSEPVESIHGWHVIQVLGKEVRRLMADQLSTVQATTFSKVTEEAKARMEIVENDIWMQMVPTTPAIPPNLAGYISGNIQ